MTSDPTLKKEHPERIASIRLHFAHQTSRKLVNQFGTIVFEDLNIENMQKRGRNATGQALRADDAPPRVFTLNHCLAISIEDVAWNMFIT